MGHYLYDDEGVKARRVTVVDKGMLKTFLLDRAPVRDFARSNGHGRAQPGSSPCRGSRTCRRIQPQRVHDKLLDMLKEEARRQGKPFGLLFDNIEGGFTNTGRGSANAFNVLPNVVFKSTPTNRASRSSCAAWISSARRSRRSARSSRPATR